MSKTRRKNFAAIPNIVMVDIEQKQRGVKQEGVDKQIEPII
jgi:hypothetical protein